MPVRPHTVRPSMARGRALRGVALTAVVGTAASGLVAAASPAGATATAGWASTATRALPLADAVTLGTAPASTPLRLTIGLTPRDRAGIDSLIRAQNTPGNPQYGIFLTPQQFTERFAASQQTADAVATYLRGAGMSNVTIAGNRLQVTADSTAAQAQSAFHTAIGIFRQGGRQVIANTAPALVPSALAGSVTGVLGLSNLGAHAIPQLAAPKTTGHFPTEFNTVYHSAGTSSGRGTTMAVIAEGDLTQTVKDLRTAEAKQGLPQTPVTLVPTGIASPDTAGAVEWNLDTQTSTGVAPDVSRLYVYVATSLTNSDLARSINAFVTQDVARAASASLGECDALPFLDGTMAVDDVALAQAAVQGQTFFASTGDTGSACAVAPTNGVPGAGLPDTEYPASSPYTTAVGGTTLVTDTANTYQSEIAWNAGGGGISPVETGGFWQTGVVPTAAVGLRGLPDVAFDADSLTGAQIYADGAFETVGGTSLSSPLAMGLWARLQASHGNKLGFAPPKLYASYKAAQGTSPLPPAAVPGFHDVVLGVNGLYTATPGWDYTTGLGSWDVAALDRVLK